MCIYFHITRLIKAFIPAT